MTPHMSRPTWARGLKLSSEMSNWKYNIVAPHVGAWIETSDYVGTPLGSNSRAPRGRVD